MSETRKGKRTTDELRAKIKTMGFESFRGFAIFLGVTPGTVSRWSSLGKYPGWVDTVIDLFEENSFRRNPLLMRFTVSKGEAEYLEKFLQEQRIKFIKEEFKVANFAESTSMRRLPKT